ncbi:MAG: DinB family protein [bacterium]|nr:DinB family protein [bacterium]
MSNLLRPIADIVNFNAENVGLALENLTQEQALERVLGGTPISMTYVVGHLLEYRYKMAQMMGLDESFPWEGLFKTQKDPAGEAEYPGIEELRNDWGRLASVLKARFESITDEEVMVDSPARFPNQEGSVRGAVGFLTWHDSYHTGHVGSIRTALKLDPIKDLFHKKHG